MKKILIALLVPAIVISLATPAFCDDALKKLMRGVCNVITCPLELLEQIKRTNVEDGPLASGTYGVAKGVGMIAIRAIVGAFEIATFPIPLPKHYGPILKDPEFFFEETNW